MYFFSTLSIVDIAECVTTGNLINFDNSLADTLFLECLRTSLGNVLYSETDISGGVYSGLCVLFFLNVPNLILFFQSLFSYNSLTIKSKSCNTLL